MLYRTYRGFEIHFDREFDGDLQPYFIFINEKNNPGGEFVDFETAGQAEGFIDDLIEEAR